MCEGRSWTHSLFRSSRTSTSEACTESAAATLNLPLKIDNLNPTNRTMSSSFTCRWGILSTGWIANKFVLDLLTDPSTRDASDVKHQVVAVGSRSTDSAKRFVEETWKEAGVTAGQDQVKLYGTYEELYRDEVSKAGFLAPAACTSTDFFCRCFSSLQITARTSAGLYAR
jgi:hypothetical protein